LEQEEERQGRGSRDEAKKREAAKERKRAATNDRVQVTLTTLLHLSNSVDRKHPTHPYCPTQPIAPKKCTKPPHPTYPVIDPYNRFDPGSPYSNTHMQTHTNTHTYTHTHTHTHTHAHICRFHEQAGLEHLYNKYDIPKHTDDHFLFTNSSAIGTIGATSNIARAFDAALPTDVPGNASWRAWTAAQAPTQPPQRSTQNNSNHRNISRPSSTITTSTTTATTITTSASGNGDHSCLLCQRRFETAAALTRHVLRSSLHASNVHSPSLWFIIFISAFLGFSFFVLLFYP
jgi:hypothetical protein